MTEYLPEGRRLTSKKNIAALSEAGNVLKFIGSGEILEAPCTLCDLKHNLHVDLGAMRGIIPKNEGAVGVEDGSTRDIALISRVGKPVCFTVIGVNNEGAEPIAVLSRKAAQEQAIEGYINHLAAGDIIEAAVTHLEPFGAFVDIGCGIPSMIPIDAISVSRINHPSDRFSTGDDIYAVVKGRDEKNHICLTHKELLGTWQENADKFKSGETVTGVVRSVEDYGIFIELAPNLAGLAELRTDIKVGDIVSVYIKAIIPEKMKVKLIIVGVSDKALVKPVTPYFITEGKLTRWVYSTDSGVKNIISDFTQ